MKPLHLAAITTLTWVVLTISTSYAQRDYGIHDPSGFVKDGDRYYTFYTSNGVECAWSTDLCTWHRGGKIFPTGFPNWINTYVSGFQGHFWAPAVFYMNNKWHVYYSCSSFGSRGSAIGLATSSSLIDPHWEDQGMVVNTNNSSDHNAIDADIMRHDGKVWLYYGSFWKGIVMTELDTTTGKPIDRGDLHYVAGGDPEAAFGMHHGEYYYLFFNRGKCCDGVNSTYYILVGRSENPAGPYLDKDGKSTSSGGGTVILRTDGKYIGPGHFGYIADNGREYMSYHYYDRNQNGMSKLKVSTLSWVDGWPVVNTDFDPCNAPPIEDCAGVENGSAYVDGCGTCVDGTTGKEPCKQDCSGEWGGDAYKDSCGVCVGGNTNLTPCAGFIEGENALSYDGSIETENEGYHGEGYINIENESGSTVMWKLCADAELTVECIFQYANGGPSKRNVSLSVNQTEQIANLEFPVTYSWTDWKTVSANVTLVKGENSISIASLNSDGGPNIDLISFSDNMVQDCATGVSHAVQLDEVKHLHVTYRDGSILLESGNTALVGVYLYSLSGRMIGSPVTRKVSVGSNRINLNTSGLSKGMYYLVVKENGTIINSEQLIGIW